MVVIDTIITVISILIAYAFVGLWSMEKTTRKLSEDSVKDQTDLVSMYKSILNNANEQIGSLETENEKLRIPPYLKNLHKVINSGVYCSTNGEQFTCEVGDVLITVDTIK